MRNSKKTTTQKPLKLQDLFENKGTIVANNQAIHDLIEYLTGLTTPRLVSFNYETEYDQSTFSILTGMPAESRLERELVILKNSKGKGKYKGADFDQAFDDLIASKEKSLADGVGNNPAYTQKGLHTHVEGENSSVKVNNNDGTVYVSGVVIRKKVNVKFKDRKPTNHRTAVTRARAIIQRELCYKFVTLKISPESIHSISFNGNRLSLAGDQRIIEVKKMQKKLNRPLTRDERDDIYSRF